MDLADLARRMFGLPTINSGEPQAYTRITRTPLYIKDELNDENAGGQYFMGHNQMEVRRDQLGTSVVPHESAHSIFDRSGLGKISGDLAARVPEAQKNKILFLKDLYPEPNSTVMANEGLGYGIGDPDATKYINYAASKIESPELRQMLLRLHQNRMRTLRQGGIGGQQPQGTRQ